MVNRPADTLAGAGCLQRTKLVRSCSTSGVRNPHLSEKRAEYAHHHAPGQQNKGSSIALGMICFRSSLAVVFAAVLFSNCAAQTKGFPNGWSETLQPAEKISGGNSLACANYSRHEWKVASTLTGVQVFDSAGSNRGTQTALPPHFVRTRQMRGVPVSTRTVDGWLVGFDAGEFGGGLWWSSEDGSTTKAMSEENVHALIPRGDAVLVFTGLDHMGSNVGAVYAYRPSDASVPRSLTHIVDLGASPGAASLTEDGDVVVVTQGSVLMLTKNNKLEPLYMYPAISALYPNSIVALRDGKLFVGMRFYVLELLPAGSDTYSSKWFVTSECRKARVEEFDCVCTANNRS